MLTEVLTLSPWWLAVLNTSSCTAWISSLEKCLLGPWPIVSHWRMVMVIRMVSYWCMSSCIDTESLSDTWPASVLLLSQATFSPCRCFLRPAGGVRSMWSCLLAFAFVPTSKRSVPRPVDSFPPCVLKGVLQFQVSRCVIHFKLTFVRGIRQESNFIHLHVAIRFPSVVYWRGYTSPTAFRCPCQTRADIVCSLTSGFSVLSRWPMRVRSHRHCAVWVPVASCYSSGCLQLCPFSRGLWLFCDSIQIAFVFYFCETCHWNWYGFHWICR